MTTGHRFAAAVLVAVMLGGFAMAAPAKVSKPSDWNEPEHIRAILSFAENEAGLPRGLSHCNVYSESRFKPTALSPNGNDRGLGQINKVFQDWIVGHYSNINPVDFRWSDPQQNAEVSCNYLSAMIADFGGSVYLGIIAYNWGPNNLRKIKKWEDIPLKKRQHAAQVLRLLDAWNEEW